MPSSSFAALCAANTALGLSTEMAEMYASMTLSRSKTTPKNNITQKWICWNTCSLDATNIVETDVVLSIPGVVVTTEGVMNGGYKPLDELERAFWTFSINRGVTDGHPEDDMVEQGDIKGFLSDPHFDSASGDVIATINILKLPDTKSMVDEIREKKRKNVSIGFLCNMDMTSGVYHNKRLGKDQPYTHIERGIVANHTAVLRIGERGACSQEMGCGIGTQKNKETMKMTDKTKTNTVEPAAAIVLSPKVEDVIRDKLVADKDTEIVRLNTELAAAVAKLDVLERQPIIDALVELTGKPKEYFGECNMAALVRQRELAEHILATRKGVGTTAGAGEPSAWVNAYDPKTSTWKQIGPGEVL